MTCTNILHFECVCKDQAKQKGQCEPHKNWSNMDVG